MSQAYHIKIDTYEGPLDLLLHLINQYEIDIYDIPVAEITKQYMNYIHTMKRLELNIASEYLVMAATLLEIKSKMLLPKQEINEDIEEYEEDPREELMQRIIKYRKFKQAANHLQEKEIDAKQIYTRPPVVFNNLDTKPTPMKGEVSIYDMIGAINRMIERKKWDEPLESRVQRIEISIEQRMEEMIHIVQEAQDGILFDQLFTYRAKSHIVVTFMALLELMRNNDVYCEQENHFGDIYVYYHKK